MTPKQPFREMVIDVYLLFSTRTPVRRVQRGEEVRYRQHVRSFMVRSWKTGKLPLIH